jgi:hypothetical protein
MVTPDSRTDRLKRIYPTQWSVLISQHTEEEALTLLCRDKAKAVDERLPVLWREILVRNRNDIVKSFLEFIELSLWLERPNNAATLTLANSSQLDARRTLQDFDLGSLPELSFTELISPERKPLPPARVVKRETAAWTGDQRKKEKEEEDPSKKEERDRRNLQRASIGLLVLIGILITGKIYEMYGWLGIVVEVLLLGGLVYYWFIVRDKKEFGDEEEDRRGKVHHPYARNRWLNLRTILGYGVPVVIIFFIGVMWLGYVNGSSLGSQGKNSISGNPPTITPDKRAAFETLALEVYLSLTTSINSINANAAAPAQMYADRYRFIQSQQAAGACGQMPELETMVNTGIQGIYAQADYQTFYTHLADLCTVVRSEFATILSNPESYTSGSVLLANLVNSRFQPANIKLRIAARTISFDTTLPELPIPDITKIRDTHNQLAK